MKMRRQKKRAAEMHKNQMEEVKMMQDNDNILSDFAYYISNCEKHEEDIEVERSLQTVSDGMYCISQREDVVPHEHRSSPVFCKTLEFTMEPPQCVKPIAKVSKSLNSLTGKDSCGSVDFKLNHSSTSLFSKMTQ